jgi:hypothetical protein
MPTPFRRYSFLLILKETHEPSVRFRQVCAFLDFPLILRGSLIGGT